MESSCEDDYFYDSELDEYDSEGEELNDDDLKHKNPFKNNPYSYKLGETKAKIYCAICAGKHTEDKCPNKTYSRSYQLNSVRENFANATKFK